MATRSMDPHGHPGLCAVCGGTAMMPRSAPAHVRVPCEACGATGCVA